MTEEEKLARAEAAARMTLIDRARGGGLNAFTVYTMPDYKTEWHHKLTMKILNRFIRREIRRLMIFEPPRHGKSELTSRRLPALIHGLYPDDEILAASYNASLAGDMTVDVQRIIDSDRYREIFPHVQITPEGRASKYTRSKFEHEIIPYKDPEKETTRIYRGAYRSAGVGGSFTGRGAHWFFIDDPFKNREDADSKAHRDMVFKWYTSSARTRMEGEGSILLTMTRWHEDDLAARLLELMKTDPDADQWYVLNLMAMADYGPDNPQHPDDPRKPGEALWPAKFDEKALRSIRASVGSREFEALYQQRPTAPEGSLIKREWIQYYRQLPSGMDIEIQSWDFAVKDKEGSDFTVGVVLGRKGADKYLIDMTRGRMNFPAACQAVVNLSGKHPRTYRKLIEDKANGPAVIDTLKKKISGLIACEPQGDKVARLNAVAPDFESGNFYIPDPSIAPWAKDVVDELCAFPNGGHDDIVDAISQGLFELRRQGPAYAPIAGHNGVIYNR